jgi:hypothetical protein
MHFVATGMTLISERRLRSQSCARSLWPGCHLSTEAVGRLCDQLALGGTFRFKFTQECNGVDFFRFAARFAGSVFEFKPVEPTGAAFIDRRNVVIGWHLNPFSDAEKVSFFDNRAKRNHKIAGRPKNEKPGTPAGSFRLIFHITP